MVIDLINHLKLKKFIPTFVFYYGHNIYKWIWA